MSHSQGSGFARESTRRLLVCLVGLLQISQALAHGTHATFIMPGEGAAVSTDLNVLIKKVPQPFPYVHIRVRNRTTGIEKWSGLVPPSGDGYAQIISVEKWESGPYVIEAQFLGDIVEQTQERSITVGTPE